MSHAERVRRSVPLWRAACGSEDHSFQAKQEPARGPAPKTHQNQQDSAGTCSLVKSPQTRPPRVADVTHGHLQRCPGSLPAPCNSRGRTCTRRDLTEPFATGPRTARVLRVLPPCTGGVTALHAHVPHAARWPRACPVAPGQLRAGQTHKLLLSSELEPHLLQRCPKSSSLSFLGSLLQPGEPGSVSSYLRAPFFYHRRHPLC